MATTDAQTLTEYTQTALKNLEETTDLSVLSNLTKELYVRAREYPTFREIFRRDDVRRAVGDALANNNAEGLRAVLIGVFTGTAQEGRPEHIKEVPGPDPFTTEDSYAAVIKLEPNDRVAQLKKIEEASSLCLAQGKAAKRRLFAEQLAKNYIIRSRAHITEEQKRREADRVEKTLSLEWYRHQAEEIKRAIEQSPYKETLSGSDLQHVARDSEKIAQRMSVTQERVEQVMTAAVASVAADEVVVRKPDVFLKIAADQAERSNAPVTQIISRAATLEQATEGFTGNPPADLPQNLSLLAKTPLQKMTAWAVNRLPEGPREAIIAGVVGGAWEKAIDTATRYYGQQIVNNDWFQQALTHGDQGLSNTKSALQSLTGGTQKVLADVAVAVFHGEMDDATIAYVENIRQHTALPTMASAIFRGPVDETTVAPTETRQPVTGAGRAGAVFRGPTTVAPTETRQPVTAAGTGAVLRGPTGEVVVTQTETVRQYIMTMVPVSYQQFYTAAVYSHNPGIFSYGLSLGLRYGTRKATRALTKAVTKQIAKKAATTAIAEGGAAAAGALGGTAVGEPLGALIGAAVGFAFDLATNLFKKGVGVFKSLVGMGTSKNPEDNLLLVVAAGIVLFFFFPVLPLFNTPAFNQSMIDTSLATNLGAGSGPGGPEVPGAPGGEPVVWSYGGTAPITNSSQLGCPVHGGTITQGPNGSFSHQGIQAYDFGNSMGAPIYATHDAYVVSFRDGIAPYTFLNHSYGNYVLLVGQLPSGSKFFTIYGHLLSVDPVVPAALNGTRSNPCKNNDPKLICKGETIGTEDATGSTWGTQPGNGIHLHYQSQGLGDLVLPPGCP